jgi:protease PrsW
MSLTDMIPGLIVASAVAPALLLLWLVVAADARPEPPRLVWICFGLGVLSAAIAVWPELLVPVSGNPTLAAWEQALKAGVFEETAKVSMIALVVLRARDFDEPLDGIVYGAAVGLGFAAVENIGYVAEGAPHWAHIAVLRALMSVPGHGAYGAIAGAYLARARFAGVMRAASSSRWRRRRLFLLAWFIPMLLHTVFDGSLMSLATLNQENVAGISILLIIALVVDVGAIVFAIRLTLHIARQQKAWMRTKRSPPAHWRALWARVLLAFGLSLAAVGLIIAGDSHAKIGGVVLMIIAVAISRHCARYLNDAAKLMHRHHTAAASS